jgi:plastocyanin
MARRFFLALVASILFVIPTARATVVQVQMLDFVFDPDSVTVSEGDTILWINNGAFPHTSTSGTSCTPNGTWDSGTVNAAGTFDHAFLTAGNFPYFCSFHCSFGMVGRAVVQVVPGVEEEGESNSRKISHSRVQPNPFRGTATIVYSLQEESPVKVEVFDIIGRRVRTLVDSRQGIGQKRVHWNGLDDNLLQVKSAIYFVKVETPAFKDVKKIILLR